MMIRALLLAAVLGFGLGGCADLGLPEQGFLTHAFDSGEDDAAPAANGCTAQGCPQAPGFCLARGYAPGTDRYRLCIASVEQNLRRTSR
ncbi:MAG: hypothetical protein WDN08_04300 [Rhizomicrobium sp.]